VSLVSKKVQNRCHVSGRVLRPILLIGSTKIFQTQPKSQQIYVKFLHDHLPANKILEM
jgi:hypothetical protein